MKFTIWHLLVRNHFLSYLGRCIIPVLSIEESSYGSRRDDMDYSHESLSDKIPCFYNNSSTA